MRTVAGYFVLALGLVLAIAFFGLTGSYDDSVGVSDGEAGSTVVVRRLETAVLADPAVEEAPDVEVRSFAPPAAFVTVAVARLEKNSPQDAVAPAREQPAREPRADARHVWSNSGPRLTSTAPGDSAAERELVRTLQAELTRSGCYSGSANGAWDRATMEAMLRFLGSANAVLPVDRPDYAHLALVKGHALHNCERVNATTVAATPQPAQDGWTAHVPAATDARDATAAPDQLPTATETAAQQPAPAFPDEDRMAVGGPEVQPEPKPRTAPRRSRKAADHFIHPLGKL